MTVSSLMLRLALLSLIALFGEARTPKAPSSADNDLPTAVAGDNLGYSVSGAGDVNRDGFADFIIGAHLESPNGRALSGAAYVFLGKASGFPTVDTLSFTSGDSAGFIIQGAVAGDSLGYSVSGAGDVNRDGFDDVIVGAYLADPYSRVDAGNVYVIFGMAGGFANVDMLSFTSSASTGFIIQGAVAGDSLGYSVSGAGDINNDGFDDVVIGAYLADPNSRVDAGTAYVIF
jgi:hypothetical protein